MKKLGRTVDWGSSHQGKVKVQAVHFKIEHASFFRKIIPWQFYLKLQVELWLISEFILIAKRITSIIPND